MRQRGFTLIELLVVIAIIALLVSILLPSLSRAKDLARDAVCQSSLRQISTTVALYSHDHSDRYPAMSAKYEKGNNQFYWYNLLAPYAGGECRSGDWLEKSAYPGHVPMLFAGCPSYSADLKYQVPLGAGLRHGVGVAVVLQAELLDLAVQLRRLRPRAGRSSPETAERRGSSGARSSPRRAFAAFSATPTTATSPASPRRTSTTRRARSTPPGRCRRPGASSSPTRCGISARTRRGTGTTSSPTSTSSPCATTSPATPSATRRSWIESAFPPCLPGPLLRVSGDADPIYASAGSSFALAVGFPSVPGRSISACSSPSVPTPANSEMAV